MKSKTEIKNEREQFMVIRRCFSLFVDLGLAAMISLGAYLSGFDYLISFIAIYILGVTFEAIHTGGRTFGMIMLSIAPKNYDNSRITNRKIVFYHIVWSIFIYNAILHPYLIILALVMIIPYKSEGRFSSALDLLFKIHWVSVKPAFDNSR